MAAASRRPLHSFVPVCVWLAAVAMFTMAGCVQVQCQLNSDCPEHSSCISNQCISRCGADRDCPASAPFCTVNGMCAATMPDAGVDATQPDVHETGVDVRDTTPPIDNTPPPIDVPMGVDNVVPTDNPPPPVDVPSVGRGYLDTCASNSDCGSGTCTTTAPRFCTRACSVHSDCADGQVCAAGHCVLDDTGTTGCNPSTGAPCLQYCYGSGTAAHCTRDCSTPSDCPSGFSCSPVSGRHVCVKIEIPCSAASDCPSGLGFCGAGMDGCTANCATASDCPLRLPGLPPYTCESQGGQMVCVPPADVVGSDPAGATCAATGTVFCRSGACDSSSTPPMCIENCTSRGGCGPGFGCYPDAVDATSIYFVCHPAGHAWVNEACSRSSDCYTGLCDTSNFCSRLCNDGLCPTGMTCTDTGLSAVDGTRIRLCRR